MEIMKDRECSMRFSNKGELICSLEKKLQDCGYKVSGKDSAADKSGLRCVFICKEEREA